MNYLATDQTYDLYVGIDENYSSEVHGCRVSFWKACMHGMARGRVNQKDFDIYAHTHIYVPPTHSYTHVYIYMCVCIA